jgi:ribonuclease BN (tRNA processing enzyme)
VSHLHGDHFGGLPFLLLDCQFSAGRTRPLAIAGPPGLRNRLEQTLEALFPGATAIDWSFPWHVVEIPCGGTADVAGFQVDTRQVSHPSGAPATALRLVRGQRVFAYSGDTDWTEALVSIADGADLFIVECSAGYEQAAHHLNWPTLKAKLPRLAAARTVVTHMGDSALALGPEMQAAGLTLAHDGLVIDL